MSTTESLLPIIREDIHFDSLLEQARQTVAEHASKSWSDTAEHDPGITLLEALGYGVADLAYRQTLPLTDLLTPPPEVQKEGDGVFPVEFGPHQALTCGPISEADYRRALLDLHSSSTDDGDFFFCNAQLIREPDDESYQYWYNSQEREYSFNEPRPEDTSVELTLRGNYYLYVWPSRETQNNPEQATAALDAFLVNHRNLGEAVSRIIWLEPNDLMVETVIELQEDIGNNSNIAAILAEIYRVTEEYVTPPVQRYSTATLQAQGLTNESIYQGPWLKHGWVPQLPPDMTGSDLVTLNFSGLSTALLAIEGVKGIRSLGTDQSQKGQLWQWSTSDVGCYPRLWGADPLSVLATGQKVTLLASGDVPLTATEEEIQAELNSQPLIHNTPQILPYGRWRDVARYYTATDSIPPCYNLLTTPSTLEQEQLHQFLLMFEQIVSNDYQRQALLPKLLAFKREGDAVWGKQWPFSGSSMADLVHQDYRDSLENILQESSHDRKHELAVIEFLLSYFNSPLAPEVFLQSSDTYLASQQGYLSRHSLLTYHRANIRIGQVSAFQQRIAAKLGLGGRKIFDDHPDLGTLPFYLVEHQQLLPAKPHVDYFTHQTPVNAEVDIIEGEEYITLSSSDTEHLIIGQLVDVMLYQGANVLTIRGQMVRFVDPDASSFSLSLAASDQLQRYRNEIVSQPPEQLAWKNSDVWLKDMDYPLTYANDQGGLDSDEKRLSCMPFPVMATVGDELVLRYQITPESEISQASETDIRAKIVSIDRIGNTLVVRNISEVRLPDPDTGMSSRYHWHFSSNSYASADRFSFMVSAVFNQNLLLDLSSDPYATEAWVKEVILAEIPSHIGMLIHWMPNSDFKQFSLVYSRWQQAGAPLGDDSYDLLYDLALGGVPKGLTGIGSTYVATDEQKEQVVGSDGTEWNHEVVTADELLYVPPESGSLK